MRKLFAIAAILAPAAAFAGGYVVPNTNARDLAMSGAAVAAQDSAGAVFQLPAALAGLDGLNILVGGGLIDIRSTWTDSFSVYHSDPVTMVPKAAFPPSLYAAYGFKVADMKAGIGAGFGVPGGGLVFWPNGWAGNGEILTVDRKVFGIYLTGGIQVIPQLKLGGGLIYYRTTEKLSQGLNFLDQQGTIQLGTAGGAASFDLSAELTPIKDLPLVIAADYKHQGVQTLTGHAHGDGIPAGLVPNLLDQGITHVLTFPNQTNLGVSYRVIEPLLIGLDWTWERFIVYKNDVFTGDRGVTVVVPRNYKNGYTLRLGGEYTVSKPLKIRGGILHDTSPSRDETTSPTLPDADVWAVSVGAGYEVIPNLTVNAAYFHAFYATKTTVGTEVFQGSYDTRTNIYSLALTWAMK